MKLIQESNANACLNWRRHIVNESSFHTTVSPTPDCVAAIAENISLLMQQLTDEQSRIALLKPEGYTDAEIAQQLKISIATTERRLRRIRETWKGFLEA